MKTPFPNAFTIHKLGLAARPFPFLISAKRDSSGMTHLDLCPQSVIDVADLIQSRSQETLLVFDVAHGTMERLDHVARAMALAHTAYRPNAIAIARSDLGRLLTDLGHWEFHLLDHPDPPPSDQVDSSALAAADFPPPDFPGSRVALHSHDDCYLSLRASDEAFLRAVLARTLEIYAGALLGKDAEPDVSELPGEVLDQLWILPLTLTFLREDAFVHPNEVLMGFSRTEFSFREERAYPLAGHVAYRPATGSWSLHPRA